MILNFLLTKSNFQLNETNTYNTISFHIIINTIKTIEVENTIKPSQLYYFHSSPYFTESFYLFQALCF